MKQMENKLNSHNSKAKCSVAVCNEDFVWFKKKKKKQILLMQVYIQKNMDG